MAVNDANCLVIFWVEKWLGNLSTAGKGRQTLDRWGDIGYATSLTDWLTYSITPWLLVDLIDVTLACKDSNSKLVEVVTVADAEKRVDYSLVQIWKLKFGQS